MFFASTLSLFSQNPSGISINWDANVGCQVYSEEIKDRKDPVFIEDIPPGLCITVCESSTVNYTLSGTFTTTPLTTWSVIGGTINSQMFNNINITWGSSGNGSLTFVTATPSGNITKTICFNKVILPTALFNVLPNLDPGQTIFTCVDQAVYFTNLSTTNGGSGLYSYNWDFGDGSPTSAEFQPNHIYTLDGSYVVTLIVTNSCGCSSKFNTEVKVDKSGFNIQCPSVLCDGQSGQYSIPLESASICNQFNWTVIGGEITSQSNGIVNVIWNNIDATGFGYVTFNPNGCDLQCPTPTTVKIPVIQNVGTITGNNFICLGEQGRYVLPQWPTTDFVWTIVGATITNPIANVIHTDQRNEVIINPLFAGTITLKCVYMNTLLHCGGSATFTINVIQPLVIIGPSKLCKNTNATYSLAPGEVSNWILTTSAGAPIATASNSNTFTYNFTTSGDYQLSLGGSGTPQCPSAFVNIEVVTILPPTATSITGDLNNICPNSPYIYSIVNPQSGVEYVWSVPSGGTFEGPSTGDSVTIKFNTALTHQISVFSRTLAPLVCTSTSTTLNVNTLQISARITDGLPHSVCANKYENYQVNSLPSGSLYNDGETYSWSISPAYLGSVSTGAGTNSVAVLWNNVTVPTNATLSLTITKCTVTTTITKIVTVVPIPVISIAATNSAGTSITGICSGSPVTFTVSAANGFVLGSGTSVNWDFGNGVTQTTTGLSVGYTFSNLTNTNAGYTVKATIVNPGGCAGTANATFQFTIFPGPTALLSIASGGNGFCPNETINTVLAITSSTAGATFKWYKAGGSTILSTAGTLSINGSAALGFGSYYVLVTNAAGCATYSNQIEVVLLDCDPPQFCTVSPTPNVTNTSSIGCIAPTTATNCNCGIIKLTGVTTPTPVSVKWDIFGPNYTLLNFTGTSIGTAALPLMPGNYNIIKKVVFTCTNGQLAKKNVLKTVVVPYIADFAYTVLCGTNGNYNIKFIDKSPFYASVPVGSRTFKYYRSTSNAGPWTLIGSTQNYTLNNVATGNYFFKIVVTGTLAGVAQTPCEKIIPINIAIPAALSITVGLISCHDTPVNFNVIGVLATDTYFWTFDAGATNTLKNPQRVFNNSGPQTVTLVVTDKYGCSRPPLTVNINIPAKCFNGSIVSSPNPPQMCKGSPINLQYVPTSGECPAILYTWMNGTNMVGTSTVPNYNITLPGFYWVRVKSANGCTYETTQRITPTFRQLPTLTMPAIGTICADGTNVTIATNVTTIAWTVDGTPRPLFNNLLSVNLTSLSVGTHTISVTVTGAPADGSCSKTASQTFTVTTPPGPTIITKQLISCNPFSVQLIANNAATGTFNWSNGTTGSSTIVTSGGPYGVTFTPISGACSIYAQTDVPKSPEVYLWSFPTGCYNGCTENRDTILGPQLPFNWGWNWLLNQNVIAQGTGFVAPLLLTTSGLYNLNINNGLCEAKSGDMEYKSFECLECKIKVDVKDIQIIDDNLCISRVFLVIDNQSGSVINGTITNASNQVVISPSGVVLQPGINYLTFDFIPINGFLGGVITFQFNGATRDGKPCLTNYRIELKYCRSGFGRPGLTKTKTKLFDTSDLVIAPNPAKNSTNITFSNTTTPPLLEIYSVLGKLLTSYQATSNKDAWQLDTSNLSSGLYIVVLKEDNQIKMQKKLIIE